MGIYQILADLPKADIMDAETAGRSTADAIRKTMEDNGFPSYLSLVGREIQKAAERGKCFVRMQIVSRNAPDLNAGGHVLVPFTYELFDLFVDYVYVSLKNMGYLVTSMQNGTLDIVWRHTMAKEE